MDWAGLMLGTRLLKEQRASFPSPGSGAIPLAILLINGPLVRGSAHDLQPHRTKVVGGLEYLVKLGVHVWWQCFAKLQLQPFLCLCLQQHPLLSAVLVAASFLPLSLQEARRGEPRKHSPVRTRLFYLGLCYYCAAYLHNQRSGATVRNKAFAVWNF